ncbi:hypothetical protein ABZ848_06760 [Streptomyces sp. NPDC047081]|uniref:hypothetical protein n=1 Tax=Streptomyces sp. NPDC047081 TaxID=3154706 RepID=UPI0034091F06
MIILILLGVLVLVIGGCVCVVWASRGDSPRAVRGAAAVTLAAGEVVRKWSKDGDRHRNESGGDA